MESVLAGAIGWSALAAGMGCLVIALILAIATREERNEVKRAAKEMLQQTRAAAQNAGTFGQQAGPLSTGLDSVTKLAGALRDLDRVAQLLVVSLGFFSVAGVVAGLDQVAQAIGK